MVLKTKSIRAREEQSDGLRICVMRHYNPERHPEYYSIDERWIELSPSSELLDEYHKGLPWEQYVMRFNTEVIIPQASKIEELARLAVEKDVTILCYEESPENCHRRLVALTCQMYQPKLELILE